MQGEKRSWGLVAWRLGVATSALTGVWLASRQYDVWWTALSQLASLGAGVGYLVLAAGAASGRTGPRRALASAWFRGATATTMVLVASAFLAMQHGNLLDPYSIFEHMLTPALVVTDHLLVGVDRAGARRWHPWSWLLPPAAYLAYYVVGDLRVYMDLDPSRPAAFTAHTAVLLGVLLVSAFALAPQPTEAGHSGG
ncbi:hypothetical protein DDE18_06060 [Nocardioides gansuensis]|uniref:Integral membrane regulator n=1 Tax=Nocardioides gansuensis TaxID=2138300 RepID=A0A2T8FDR4_9ACTN|nr:hypothetical protein [Nocardioides gansuensis]PVG83861.1 hypothetical protein DDE18_06060 [Nocardioides gansuensis]